MTFHPDAIARQKMLNQSQSSERQNTNQANRKENSAPKATHSAKTNRSFF